MSILVFANGEPIWNPSRQVGELFAEELRALEPMVGTVSSFIIDDADEVHLDRDAFDTFVIGLIRAVDTTDHPAFLALAAGPAQVAIALQHRLTGTWPTVSQRCVPLVTGAQSLARQGVGRS